MYNCVALPSERLSAYHTYLWCAVWWLPDSWEWLQIFAVPHLRGEATVEVTLTTVILQWGVRGYCSGECDSLVCSDLPDGRQRASVILLWLRGWWKALGNLISCSTCDASLTLWSGSSKAHKALSGERKAAWKLFWRKSKPERRRNRRSVACQLKWS